MTVSHLRSKRLLPAIKTLTPEEFGLKCRYAMVLHTDEPHPHVHLVVKAIEFAWRLRAGVGGERSGAGDSG
jgi:relaxase-like protein